LLSPSSIRPGSSRQAWVVWASAVAVYLLAVFHRTSLSVAGIAAAERFHISASQLSSFTILQLLVYAGMQLPVGVLLDRYGSRRLLTTGLLLMTAGQLGMAFVSSYGLALATRGLVGIGDSMTFVSVLRLVSAWFPSGRHPLLTQLTAFCGQVGAVMAALPMAHLLSRFGWSATYAGAAIAGLALGAIVYALVIDSPDGTRTSGRMQWRDVLDSIRECWANPGTKLGVWVHFCCLMCPNVLALLWGYPWLVEGQQTSIAVVASLLTLLTAASMIGGPSLGLLISRRPAARLPVLCVVLGATIMTWTLILAWPGPAPHALLGLLMALAGMGVPVAMIGFDYARATNAGHRVGIAMAIVNVGGFLSSVLVILGIGVALDLSRTAGSTYDPAAFSMAMLTPYAAWGIGVSQIVRYLRRQDLRHA
jgi:sugar phosphate permease